MDALHFIAACGSMLHFVTHTK